MINKLTEKILSEILDDAGFTFVEIDGGGLMCKLDADDDFEHDVYFIFDVDKKSGRLSMNAEAGKDDEFNAGKANLAKAIMKCNEHNNNYYHPKAYVQVPDGKIFAERTWFIEGPVSKEYLMDEIKQTMTLTWKFFCDFNGEKRQV